MEKGLICHQQRLMEIRSFQQAYRCEPHLPLKLHLLPTLLPGPRTKAA